MKTVVDGVVLVEVRGLGQMARGDLLILGRQNEEWVPHRLSGCQARLSRNGNGRRRWPQRPSLVYPVGRIDGPVSTVLDLLGPAVGTN